MSTAASVQLIPLKCVDCGTAVPAQVNEVAWVCEQCGRGLVLDAARGTAALVVFFSSAVPEGQVGRPFWVSRGQVTLQARETYKGDQGNQAREFWAVPRLFFIPAWDCPVNELIEQGKALLKNPVEMTPGSRVPFLPVVTLPTDLKALGEFLVLSIEAARSDYLKGVDFDLRLDPPQLWVLA